MPSGLSTYLSNKLLEHSVGKTSYTLPTLYVGCSISATTPTADGANVTEPTGGSYARKSTAGSDWAPAAGRVIANAAEIAMPAATGNWGTVYYLVFYDAASAGNFLGYVNLNTPIAVNNGQTLKFAASQITWTVNVTP